MKFFKQSTYSRYVLPKPSKFVQTSTLTFSNSFLGSIPQKIKKAWNISRQHFSYNFLIKKFLLQYCRNWPSLLPDCVYFPSYSVKCVTCFMFGHLMTSWHLNIWKVKIRLSQERKEPSNLDKKYFSLFHKCSLVDINNKLAKT